MTTSVDICNRALVVIGRPSIITDLGQDSVEAKACNTVYLALVNWCFGLANWNFARKTAALTLLKSVAAGPPSPWTNASPAPPWTKEYAVPADFIRAQYLTDATSLSSAYIGDTQRMVVANDTIATVQQQVILTKSTTPVLVYTGLVSDPTLWPWYFERLVVYAIAWNICPVLIGAPEITKTWKDQTIEQFMIAHQSNKEEGLFIIDSTPEWIQAIGMNYPYRRDDGKLDTKVPQDKAKQ